MYYANYNFSQGNFFGNTQIIITNGHRTHQTLILLTTMSGELCLNDIKIPSTSWRMSCKQYFATQLNQQGHTELCQKTSSLCESWGRALSTRLEINCFCGVLNC